jgi:hypothetical protein
MMLRRSRVLLAIDASNNYGAEVTAAQRMLISTVLLSMRHSSINDVVQYGVITLLRREWPKRFCTGLLVLSELLILAATANILNRHKVRLNRAECLFLDTTDLCTAQMLKELGVPHQCMTTPNNSRTRTPSGHLQYHVISEALPGAHVHHLSAYDVLILTTN